MSAQTRAERNRHRTGPNKAQERNLRDLAKASHTPTGLFGRHAGPSQESIRKYIAAQMCPWCGRGPYKILAGHTQRAHAVSAVELRELAGLVKTYPICSDEVSQQRVARMKGKRLPDVAYERAPTAKRTYSTAGLAVQRAKLDAVRSPEQARMASRARVEKVMNANAPMYERIVQLFHEGLTLAAIAEQLGVSIPSVKGALNRAGLDHDLVARRHALMSADEKRRRAETARRGAQKRHAERRERISGRFQELGGDWAAVHALATEERTSVKQMRAYLVRIGAPVPDGRKAKGGPR